MVELRHLPALSSRDDQRQRGTGGPLVSTRGIACPPSFAQYQKRVCVRGAYLVAQEARGGSGTCKVDRHESRSQTPRHVADTIATSTSRWRGNRARVRQSAGGVNSLEPEQANFDTSAQIRANKSWQPLARLLPSSELARQARCGPIFSFYDQLPLVHTIQPHKQRKFCMTISARRQLFRKGTSRNAGLDRAGGPATVSYESPQGSRRIEPHSGKSG